MMLTKGQTLLIPTKNLSEKKIEKLKQFGELTEMNKEVSKLKVDKDFAYFHNNEEIIF